MNRGILVAAGLRGAFMHGVTIRGILIGVSVLGTMASFIAVVVGGWVYGIAIYSMTVSGLWQLLRRSEWATANPGTVIARRIDAADESQAGSAGFRS